jgi:hypothetical protein
MEETNELRAQALIDCVTLLLLKHGCITDGEAEGLLDLTLEKGILTAKVLGLEERALECDNKEVALVAIKLLSMAWKELSDSIIRGLAKVGERVGNR